MSKYLQFAGRLLVFFAMCVGTAILALVALLAMCVTLNFLGV